MDACEGGLDGLVLFLGAASQAEPATAAVLARIGHSGAPAIYSC
jgi:hypothetical protein